MRRIIRALLDGFVLRCPRCRRGRMFRTWFRMREACPVCGLQFERSSGEITGGIAINTVVTQAIVFFLGAGLAFFTDTRLAVLLGTLILLAILFPIAFYHSSRGLWASFLYLTGDNQEPD
jgi:uncharacterized protein (DUF983 family)